MKGGDKNMLKAFKSVVLAIGMFGFLFSATPAFAQSATLWPRGQVRCTAATTRINNLITRIESNQGKAEATYQKLADYLKKKGEKLQSTNPTAYATLNGYYSTLVSTYTPKITSGYQTYVTDLRSAQSMAQSGQCGTSDGAFRQAIVKIKGDHQQVKSDIASARTYYLQTIKPYILSLR